MMKIPRLLSLLSLLLASVTTCLGKGGLRAGTPRRELKNDCPAAMMNSMTAPVCTGENAAAVFSFRECRWECRNLPARQYSVPTPPAPDGSMGTPEVDVTVNGGQPNNPVPQPQPPQQGITPTPPLEPTSCGEEEGEEGPGMDLAVMVDYRPEDVGKVAWSLFDVDQDKVVLWSDYFDVQEAGEQVVQLEGARCGGNYRLFVHNILGRGTGGVQIAQAKQVDDDGSGRASGDGEGEPPEQNFNKVAENSGRFGPMLMVDFSVV